ncbi:hypothetical protein Bbelb_341070 [Branchiostoma belcheri]|nr:hypothetical protein Bbelb_341070 [Branchiostoma belcheri]
MFLAAPSYREERITVGGRNILMPERRGTTDIQADPSVAKKTVSNWKTSTTQKVKFSSKAIRSVTSSGRGPRRKLRPSAEAGWGGGDLAGSLRIWGSISASLPIRESPHNYLHKAAAEICHRYGSGYAWTIQDLSMVLDNARFWIHHKQSINQLRPSAEAGSGGRRLAENVGIDFGVPSNQGVPTHLLKTAAEAQTDMEEYESFFACTCPWG